MLVIVTEVSCKISPILKRAPSQEALTQQRQDGPSDCYYHRVFLSASDVQSLPYQAPFQPWSLEFIEDSHQADAPIVVMNIRLTLSTILCSIKCGTVWI